MTENNTGIIKTEVEINMKDIKNKKKVCRFCETNEYDGKYIHHLNENHKDVINNRIISKHLTAEQLEEVRKFILNIKKHDQR